jgi:phosphatidylglycerophosphatase C
MTAADDDTEKRWVAVFDLDGTLTWRDTLWPFLVGYLQRHPERLPGAWRLLPAVLGYALGGQDRGDLKSRVIRVVMGGESRTALDSWADAFVAELMPNRRLRPAALAVLEAHRSAGDHLILLSASPDLYVPRIGRALGFERIICTELEWRGERLDGALKSPNRQGREKVRCLERLRAEYAGMPVVAYGNTAGDLEHLRMADKAMLVNGSAAARRAAAKLGIVTSVWT